MPGKSISDTSVTVGKSIVDMAKYCKDENTTQQAMVPITFKIGSSTTQAHLRLSITTIFLGDSNEDGNTEVSGLTGLTSDHGSVREQDLEGTAWAAHASHKLSNELKCVNTSAYRRVMMFGMNVHPVRVGDHTIGGAIPQDSAMITRN